jgi:hypothetical protein
MALVTYILLSTLIAGLRGKFQPELLGYTASISLAVVVVEIIALQLGSYLLGISSQSQVYDLIAYSGYKFVGIIITIVLAEIFSGGKGTGGWVGWIIFLYTFFANSLFLVCTIGGKYDAPVRLTWYFLTDAIAEICSATGVSQQLFWHAHANRHPGQAQPANTVPLLLFLHRAVYSYVDTHPCLIRKRMCLSGGRR